MVTEFERGVEEAKRRDLLKDFINSLVLDAAHKWDGIIYSEEYRKSFVDNWTKKLKEVIKVI